MSAAKQYYQCLLRRPMTGHSHIISETVGWIEARGAKAGAFVELLPSREQWEVIEVFHHGMSQDVLKEHQLLHRNSLPSVEGMG